MFDSAAFVASLPAAPGVYRMLDASGRVLYVGKAKDLRRRVAWYFAASAARPARTRRMIARTASMQATPTGSESEALVLERSLIRALAPRFNIQFRDDSSYPYIVVSDERWPRLRVTRRPSADDGEAFGPYPAMDRAWRAADLLRRAFRIRPCDDATFAHRSRPCLQHQMKRCSAPCVGLVDAADYVAAVDDARRVLRGDAVSVRRALVARMREAADALQFERAAVLRDRIADLAAIAARQSVDGQRGADIDVLVLAEHHGMRLIAVGMLRDGSWRGERFVWPSEPDHDDPNAVRASAAELVDACLQSFDEGAAAAARRLLLPDGFAPDAELRAWLDAQGVSIVARATDDMRRWRRMTLDAAVLQLRARDRRALVQRERATALGALLGRSPPARIECVDVSHTGGERAVASCVVWEGGLRPSRHRRYDVAPAAAGDDCAAIEEAVRRRFERPRRDDATRPQLLVIDGGAAQAERARGMLARLGVDVPVLGLAKGARHARADETIHLAPPAAPLHLPGSHPALLLLQDVRDEAHRVALAGHRARRAAARTADPLESIRGLGPTRRRALLESLGGRAGVRAASERAIGAVHGIGQSMAHEVWRRLHGERAST